MQTLEFALTCHRIGKISMKNEGSDFAILPASLKPQKPNVLGYYIFKITSDLSSRWTYCRVVEWTEGDRDCYLPTWMMNYLHIPDHCEAKFTYDHFSIKKCESLVIQPTDEIFASYSYLVELSGIRAALNSYTTLTNNSRIVLNVDGQKFSVIVRLLKPEDRVRVTSKMNIIVSKSIYRKHGIEAVDESKKYEDMNITDTVTNDLLGGLCPHCYRILADCKCDERRPITECNRSELKAEEEETRRLAVKTLEELYCMNCFQLHSECQCVNHNNHNEREEEEKETIEAEEELEEGGLEEQTFDIMQVIEKEVKEDVERKVEERTKQLEEEGKSKEEAFQKATVEVEQQQQEQEQEPEEETPSTPLPAELEPVIVEMRKEEEEAIPVTDEAVNTVMESIKPKLDHLIFYYWPILPKEHCQRWEVDKAVMIPPPPPEVTEQDDKVNVAKKSFSLWSIFRRS